MSRVLVDSGIGYLGNIPSEWNIFRIKNAFKCKKNIVNDNWSNTQLLSLTTSGVKEKDIDNPNGKLPDSFNGYQYVEINNIIMCLFDLDCSAVFSGISKYNGMISPAYKVLKCKEIMNPDYAGYYFNYISFDRKYMHYSKNIRYTLNYDEFSSLPMLIPPKEEQKRIAQYLDRQCVKIDQTIEDNKREIELLQELNEQIILNEINKYNQIKLKYILKDGKSMRVGPFGTQLTNKDYVDDGYWVYNQRVVLDNNYTTNDTFITQKKYEEMESFKVQSGDILLTTRGTIGRISIVPTTYKAGILHPCIIKFNVKNYDEDLLKYIFNETNYIKEQLQLMSNSTTIDVVYSYNLREVLLPNIEYIEQKKLVANLNRRCSKLKKVMKYRQKIIEKLEEYKRSLIYECVTGKREV